MAFSEVFPNPTIRQVVFQIRFPNLFFLESLVGKFQISVMKEFPKSQLLMRRQFVIVSESDQEKADETIKKAKEDGATSKIWQFSSDSGVKLELATDSLTLVTDKHKSYRLGESDRFRDVIESVTGKFFKLTEIPLVTRIGLRYVDDCPIPENTTQCFQEYYNIIFPLERFPIEEADSLQYVANMKLGTHKLRYAAQVEGATSSRRLVLDFDCSSENIDASQTLDVCDQLHEIISDQFEKTVREPVLEYMRRQPEEKK